MYSGPFLLKIMLIEFVFHWILIRLLQTYGAQTISIKYKAEQYFQKVTLFEDDMKCRLQFNQYTVFKHCTYLRVTDRCYLQQISCDTDIWKNYQICWYFNFQYLIYPNIVGIFLALYPHPLYFIILLFFYYNLWIKHI